jgi:acetoin utilization deacetylase AcuC-like enzyme
MQLGGGFHHAYPDHGEGFCMFNDVAVAVRTLVHEGLIRRAAIVDLDVHHGNGTAAIFGDDSAVFTFSMHQENNYPAEKPPSTLDLHLGDGVEDEEYLERLGAALPAIVEFRPDLVFYLAGADPYHGDQLGGLSLTFDGLRARDALVLGTFRRAGVPVAITLAGGYAHHTDDTIAIHCATAEEAFAVLRA